MSRVVALIGRVVGHAPEAQARDVQTGSAELYVLNASPGLLTGLWPCEKQGQDLITGRPKPDRSVPEE